MKKTIIYLAMLLTLTSINATEFSVYEANYPNVKDYNVNIDEATLVVRPVGDYVEFNLYMTVSYDFESWFFKNYNELEFKWQFDLPSNAIMHEFWCWEGDSIISATILDKWTAELLFNDVSTPIRNPGLLTQSSPNRSGQVTYDLRLFPIKRNEHRRFKIQYLLPARPAGGSVRVWLPMTQLVSKNTPGIKNLKIIYKYGNNPYEPQIVGTSVIQSQDNPSIAAWELEIPVEFDQFVEMELPSPIKSNIFLSTFSKNNENFYHLAVYPPTIPRVATPRKVLIVIDYNRFNTKDLDGDFLLSYLKESIMQAFSSEDSINVLAAYDELVLGSDSWVPCTKAGVDELFSKVMMRSFPSYNNLLPLITRASQFINSQSGNAEVLFLTNTTTVNLSGSALTSLADEVVNKFVTGTKLHFIDLENKSGLTYNSSGYYESQMQSFYGRITYPSSGNLFFLRYNTIKEILYSFLFDEISHFESVEVQMRFQNGYANSKHFIALNEGYYPLNTPIMQLGKYTGDFPVEITVFGKYKTTTQNYSMTISKDDVTQGSEQLATAWYGGHIQSMLQLASSALTITDILKISLEQKILTPYSGFLVYQHDENHGYCTDCIDETSGATEVEECNHDTTNNFEVNVYPNPFNPSTTISYELSANSHVKAIVYNILGERIAELLNTNEIAGKHNLTFNGSNYASGLYIITLSVETNKKNYFVSQKLLMIK